MKAVYKYVLSQYPVEDGNYIKVRMPYGAKFLTVQEQRNELCVWALVDPNEPEVTRIFEVIGTGWVFENADVTEYLGTVQKGPLVWHVFVDKK